MSLNPSFLLVENRAQGQIAFEIFERLFHVGKLDIEILVKTNGFFSRVLLTSYIRMASLNQSEFPPHRITGKGSYKRSAR